MAQEIAILTGNGERVYDVLMLFPIATPTKVNSVNVVPTPSTTLTAAGALVLTASEKAALDAGTMGYRVTSMNKAVGMTGPQLQARVQAIYAQALIEFTRWYTETYRHIGVRVDAP